MRANDRCTHAMLASCLLAGVLCTIVILDYSGYPFAPYELWILEYHLRNQDLAGSALLALIVLVAWLPAGRQKALAFVDAVSRHPRLVAAAAFVALCLGTLFVELDHPIAQDEYAALLQSRIFAAGSLTGLFPPELIGRLIPPLYMNAFVYGSFETGQIASAYWPGFALLLTPFTLLGASWACNALLASLALLLMARIAVRLSGVPQAGGWAMLLAAASPAFTGMALTYFSMTAHLLLNLAFVWLLLELSARRLFLAGLVGSFALILHNPVPHALFALPWIAWVALQPGARRNLLILGAGYAPIALGIGFGWALLLSHIQGAALHGLVPNTGEPADRILNFLWDWHVKLRTALAGPGDDVLATRAAELVRLWTWAVPGLPLLAAAGWWLARRDPRALVLGLSLLATLAGYLFVGFNQGHGWGARYLHPAWGALPILAALALVRADSLERCARLGGYVASLAVLSLVFATALRAVQINEYLASHLAQRPPAPREGKHVVFIRIERGNYTASLVQNDPFLRNRVWYLMSFGADKNAQLMRDRFPGARREFADRRGEVWRVD